MNGLRIIGVGSPFGSDRLGWDLALALERPLAALSPEIRCCDRPGTRLLDQLDGAEFAIILDAMSAGLPPGSIRCFAPQELEDSVSENDAKVLSSHGFGLSETLALGRRLGLLPPHLYVFGIETGMEMGEQGDSAPHADLVAELARRVMALVEVPAGGAAPAGERTS